MPNLQQEVEIDFGGMAVVLRGDGTAFLPANRILLVADLHLGKESSFRAQSIPVPEGPTATTLEMLKRSIREAQPQQLIILGDLIHDHNSMCGDLSERFVRWRKSTADLSMTLVRGNHDRHVGQFPDPWRLREIDDRLDLNPQEIDGVESEHVSLVHQIRALPATGHFIQGHWHPVVQIGTAADRTRARCFVIGKRTLTLPAFGPFKGGQVTDQRKSKVYPILEGFVLRST